MIVYWIFATIALIALIIWKGYIKPYSHWKNMGVPQAHPWFIVGDSWPTIFRIKGVKEWIDWMYNMHPGSKYVGMYHFYLPTLVLKDPEIIKQLTIKDFDYFTDHGNFAVSEEVDPLWSKNLFALKGQRWRDMRSVLSGSFTSNKMRLMYELIREEAEKFAIFFKSKNEDLLELNMKDSFCRYTTDVIASTSFGIKVNSLETPNNEFYIMGKEVSDFTKITILLKFLAVIVCPWFLKMFNIGFLSKKVRVFFTNIIEETIKLREEKGVVRPDMINLLLEVKRGSAKKKEEDIPDDGFAVIREEADASATPHKRKVNITNQDIASQAMVFFLAGFDSVSSAMSYIAYELALNPEIQAKLRKEINEVWAKCNGKPSYEDILGMKYMDMVVSESLRKWPVAPAADRICVKPYTLEPTSPGEPTITFKVNDTLWIPIISIHHDEKYYPDPEKFIPERFSEANKGNILPYTYLPFGVGPRACIGSRFALLEIKAIMFYLLKNFEVVLTKNTRIPLKFVRKSIALTPEGGIPLGLKSL
ncbi:cytochrome P450 9e2-like [Euwallacea similis]|uniref:cytochrome P450 9e2-like n=1 Tax=Euwallacea similis TaxID=1736056 RepID=UPI00344B3653